MTKRQLRSQALEERIELVIREMAAQSGLQGKLYVYNASHIAKEVPTTRKTLAKYNQLVTRVLKNINAGRRMLNGSSSVEQLKEQIEHLKQLILYKDEIINGLRVHHIELYKRLYDGSIKAEILIRPPFDDEINNMGKCFYCGSNPDHKVVPPISNIVKFSKD
jgi:hypothetical protein